MTPFRIGSFGFRNIDLHFAPSFATPARLDAAAELRAGNRLRLALPAIERKQQSLPPAVSTRHVIERDLFVRQTPAGQSVERSLREYFSRQFAPPPEPAGPPVEKPSVEASAVEAPAGPPPVEGEPHPEPAANRRAAAYTATFEVVTQDGDKVSVTYNNAREREQSLKVTANGVEYSALVRSRREVSYSVEGGISDTELADIQRLSSNLDITGLGSLAAFRYSASFSREFSRGLSVAA
jgi:hypothetical protein